jgi:PST family polysaccharide transporter/lipopolysaccharide exporter
MTDGDGERDPDTGDERDPDAGDERDPDAGDERDPDAGPRTETNSEPKRASLLRRSLRAVTRSFAPGGDLATRTARSGVWMTALNVSRRALELVALLVLARLLTPDDFGLLGIALLVLTGLDRFSQLGFTSALIQNREENVDRYLDTAWSLQLLRGLILGGVTLLIAGPAADFFNEPAVEPILQVVALTPVLAGFENPGVIYFQKDLEFHRQFVHLMSTSVVYVGVTIALAFLWGNVWALVVGKVVSEVSQTVVSYLIHGYRPRPKLDREAASELIGFGKWVTVSSIIYFLADEGDDFVVGWLLTAASLGFYRLAYRLALTPVSEVTGVVSTVMFPAYSKLQDDLRAVREAFFKTIQLTTALTFPIGVGILVVAPLFVEGVLGTEWTPMVEALQILSVYGLIISLAASFGPVWLALGRPDITAKIGALRVAVMAVIIYPATTEFGLVGTAGAVIAAYLLGGLPADLFLAKRHMGLGLTRFAHELAFPAAAAGSMGAVVWTVREALVIEAALLELAVLVALGVVVYAAVAVALVRGFGWQLEQNVRSVASALGG